MEEKTIKDLNHWFWFGLIITIAPIIFGIWKLKGIETQLSIWGAFAKVIQNGELLLVCMALLGVNIGELIKEETEWKKVMTALIGFSIIMSLFVTYSFAEINVSSNMDTDYVVTTSRTLFLSTLGICIASIILPKKNRDE